jgi:hypothetical protein
MIIPINTTTIKIPKRIKSTSFIAEVLSAKHAEEDLVHVLENEKLIKRTRGNAGSWPNPKILTLEENRIDLSWHQREFENGSSFAYLMRKKDGVYIGCAYLYPMNFRSKIPDAKKYEVDFSFWITESVYKQGLYEGIKIEWLEKLKSIGFKKIYYSNKR